MAVGIQQFDFGPSVRSLMERNALAGQAQFGRQQAQDIRNLQAAAVGGQQPSPGAALGVATQPTTAPTISKEQATLQLIAKDPAAADRINKSIGLNTTRQREDFANFAFKALATPFVQREQIIKQRAADVRARGGDPAQTLQLLELDEETQTNALEAGKVSALSIKERINLERGPEVSAAQREFAELTKGLDPSEEEKARRVKLGLDPRAVGSAVQTIAELDIADRIGDTEATIAQRKKFGELTGASRSKAIDKGFDKIVKIDQGILTIDRAIGALEGGASTGAISKFLPSFRASSVALDQIRNQLALDVIGGVTLGAISEAELALAKEVALPVGLSGSELIQHLQDRKAAQQKLRGYFQEQIDFLDQGGTIAGFLREKQREQPVAAPANQTGQPQAPQQAAQPPTSHQVGRFQVEVVE